LVPPTIRGEAKQHSPSEYAAHPGVLVQDPEPQLGGRNSCLPQIISGGHIVGEQSIMAAPKQAQQPVCVEHEPQFLSGHAPAMSPQRAEQSVVASHS
jgi:hypothetical protein